MKDLINVSVITLYDFKRKRHFLGRSFVKLIYLTSQIYLNGKKRNVWQYFDIQGTFLFFKKKDVSKGGWLCWCCQQSDINTPQILIYFDSSKKPPKPFTFCLIEHEIYREAKSGRFLNLKYAYQSSEEAICDSHHRWCSPNVSKTTFCSSHVKVTVLTLG